jgi:hypothetical protein
MSKRLRHWAHTFPSTAADPGPNHVGTCRRRDPGRDTVRLLVDDPATLYALELSVIASVYIGFAVADGRPKVIASESSVAAAFVVLAAAAISVRTMHRPII